MIFSALTFTSALQGWRQVYARFWMKFGILILEIQ